MRIAFIEAQDPQRPRQLFMPLGLAYLQGWLERCGHQTKLAKTWQEALDFAPQVLGVSAVSPNFPQAVNLAQIWHQHSDAPIILGGPHITSAPQTLPDEFLAGVRGEGERTCAELLRALETGTALSQVAGLVLHDPTATNGVALTPDRPSLTTLDELPFPQRTWSQPGLPVWSFSSRGCPFRCTFCSTANFWQSYRLHSPDYVARELASILEQHRPPMHIFMDDLFAANLERLRELKGRFRERLPYAVPLSATVRADLVSEAICRELKELNVRHCHLGLESGSDKVLSYLKAQTTTAEINQRALDMLHTQGIAAVGSFIIGAPNEEEEDIKATWNFLTTNLQAGKLQSFSFGPLVAFPGTQVWEDACARGLIDPDNVDWRSLDIDLRAFNLEKYTLLSPLPRERFGFWFAKMHRCWHECLNLN